MPRPGSGTVDLSYFFVHTVTINRLTGAGAYGLTYDGGTATAGLVDDSDRLIRDTSGQEIVSSTTVLLPVSTPDVPIDSTVKLPPQFGSRESRVISVTRRDAGPLALPSHLELALL